MRERLPHIEIAGNPRTIHTDLGRVSLTDFTVDRGRYAGMVAAFPEAEPPFVDVVFVVPRGLPVYTQTYESSAAAMLRGSKDWSTEKLVKEAVDAVNTKPVGVRRRKR